MKKLFVAVCIVAVFGIFRVSAQPTSKVDERIELCSIVFRLAGAEEYVNNQVENYADDIDSYFAKYADHPAVAFAKEKIKIDGLGYGSAMAPALAGTVEKGRFRLNPDIRLDVYLSLDTGWTEKSLKTYIGLLNDFYRRTKFNRFFKAHEPLYAKAVERMNVLLSGIDTQWFELFYGFPMGEPDIYIGMANGPSNYAIRESLGLTDGTYAVIMGCSLTDGNGDPRFDPQQTTDVLLHELSHDFTHRIADKYMDNMRAAADKIFPHVKDLLAEGAYGDPVTMMQESINQLFMRMYQNEHAPGWRIYGTAEDEERGFVWMNRAVRFMDNFYADRKTYPTIAEFMPQIVGFVNYTADNMQTVMREFQNRHPYVVNVYPAPGTTVSPDLKEVRIQFSRPMHNASGIYECGQQGVTIIPHNMGHWEDDRTFVIDLKEKLKPSTAYGFALPYFMFIDRETGHRLEKNFDVVFKTAEK